MAKRRPKKTLVALEYAEFFKVFLPDLCSHQLRLPPDFVKDFRRTIKEKVILKDVGGRVWHVDVKETPSGVYLNNGWPNFIKYHDLKVGEFLVFHYDGSYSFLVKIFGTNGCKKEASSECMETEGEVEENNTPNKRPRQYKDDDHSLRTEKRSVHSKRLRAVKRVLLQEQDVSPENHVESENVLEEQDVSPENHVESQNVLEEQDVPPENHVESQNVEQEQDLSSENLVESQNVLEEQDVSSENHVGSQNVLQEQDVSPENHVELQNVLQEQDVSPENHVESQNVSQEQDVSPENHVESQNVSQEQDVSPENHVESQNVSQEQDVSPENHVEFHRSCFVSPPNSLGKFKLRIPDEMVDLEEEMILRNGDMKEWPVRTYKQSGHSFLGRGWHTFQNDNNVGVKDRCKFTFHKQRYIDVQIIRCSPRRLFDSL